MDDIKELSLGKEVEYLDQYDKSILVGVPRDIARNEIKLSKKLPFNGVDVWNCYEVSWLNKKGKPCAKIIQFIVPADSKFLIESKSVKLYLNSLNGSCFEEDSEVQRLIQKDFTEIAQKNVVVLIKNLEEFYATPLSLFSGVNIDNLDVEIKDYQVNKDLLQLSDDAEIITETLTSNLLKSNCLITNQPDWASVQIKYTGREIDHKSLLRYIISFRKHNEFHEQCVEHMFKDIMEQCSPEELTIHAKYTRRGGVDINPFRTTLDLKDVTINRAREVRQ
ncbi:MAG: NADPH-dependent 7-cyano-7-deazaguanine reductase QueF [Rickettsiaceae bacterium]|nr:NADPH-dependent 7-cyano-7-deazaguanine reductase QueF [Rickettsiaceae bacterium]